MGLWWSMVWPQALLYQAPLAQRGQAALRNELILYQVRSRTYLGFLQYDRSCPGGENIQRRNLGKAMRYLMVVCALVSTLAMFGCGGGGGDDTTTSGENTPATSTVSNVPVPASATTVQAVVGQTFTISNGSLFSSGLASTPVNLTFGAPSTATNSAPFTLTSGNSTATGTVAFGSCTFTVSISNIAGLQAPPSVTIPTFQTCNFVVTGNAPLEAGGETGQAMVILQLARP